MTIRTGTHQQIIFLGFLAAPEALVDLWNIRLAAAINSPDPPPVARKQFVSKHRLPSLSDYKSTPADAFWHTFPSNRDIIGKSAINPIQLRSLTRRWLQRLGSPRARHL